MEVYPNPKSQCSQNKEISNLPKNSLKRNKKRNLVPKRLTNQKRLSNSQNLNLCHSRKCRKFGHVINHNDPNNDELHNVTFQSSLSERKFISTGSKFFGQSQQLMNVQEEEEKIEEFLSQQLPSQNPVDEYIEDISDYIFSQDSIPFKDYMTIQQDINEKMRSILVDWLIDVHKKFQMKPETIFQSILIMDKSLQHIKISRNDLQLIGITSMFIASKYEEIYPPALSDFVYICANTFPKAKILEMETLIFKSALNFNLSFPTSFGYLKQLFHNKSYSLRRIPPKEEDTLYQLSFYALLVATMEYMIVSQFSQATITVSAIYLASKILKKKSKFTKELIWKLKINKQKLKTCAKNLFLGIIHQQKGHLNALRRKFATEEFQNIATILSKLAKRRE